ncbi:MAG: hypothetical protein LBQ48_00665 [Oscillospiraceae bacterium]|nr:hypothetical protein [Oscillospiraceae bacterium]
MWRFFNHIPAAVLHAERLAGFIVLKVQIGGIGGGNQFKLPQLRAPIAVERGSHQQLVIPVRRRVGKGTSNLSKRPVPLTGTASYFQETGYCSSAIFTKIIRRFSFAKKNKKTLEIPAPMWYYNSAFFNRAFGFVSKYTFLYV